MQKIYAAHITSNKQIDVVTKNLNKLQNFKNYIILFKVLICRSPMSTNIFPLASANMILSRMCAKSIKFQALKNKPENHWQRVKKNRKLRFI